MECACVRARHVERAAGRERIAAERCTRLRRHVLFTPGDACARDSRDRRTHGFRTSHSGYTRCLATLDGALRLRDDSGMRRSLGDMLETRIGEYSYLQQLPRVTRLSRREIMHRGIEPPTY